MHRSISQYRIFPKSAIYLALYTCWVGTAYAATEAATAQTNILPTIVVTADDSLENNYTKKNASTSTKLNLSVKETPQSVSVITQKQMEDMGATNLGEALLNTTGIILTGDNTERTNFSIRGFNMGDGWNSNLMQYDGVAVNATNVASSKPDMAMLESVEVLRGAAGLLQGSGEPAGTVNLIRKKPTADFHASGAVSYGSWNTVRGEVDVSNRLNESGTVRGRLVLAYQDGDSWMKAVTRDSNLLYGIISADLTKNTLLNFGYSQQKEHAVPVNSLPRYSDGSDIGLDRDNCGCDYRDFWDKKNSQAFIDLTHQFENGWMVKGSYLRADIDMDMAFTSLAFASTGAIDKSNPKATINKYGYRYNQQLDVFDFFTKGTFNLLGREHELVAGINHQKSDIPGQWTSWDTMMADGSLWDRQANTKPVGVEQMQVNVFDFDPYGLPYAAPRYDQDGGRSYVQTEQTGLYLTTRWNLADSLKLITGVRESNFKYDSEYQSNVTGKFVDSRAVHYKKDNIWTPYVGLTYDFNDTYTGYASFTDTFVVQNVKDRNEKLLDPVQGNVYEIGLKGSFNDDKLIASIAAFRTNQINRAIQDQSSKGQCAFNGGEGYCNTSAGEVISEGIETELRGEVLPNLNLSAGYTYNTTEYKKDIAKQGQTFNETTPEHIARLFATYKLPNNLTVGGGVNYQSEWLVGRYGSKPAKQEGYALVNLMASYPLSENITIAVNANNVLDKKYYSYLTTDSNRYGEPRNMKLTLRAKF
ncbi:TonB-dependent siderophore receptor [Acinetobacter vivianii]|uniref:TonB-dependent siderophore receptor n=1 Tax=Acinetobacter vivianii TaxID=1776742 RepID=UPI002DB84457|nr:TonB-dependent siderophore receptor [Acinetobacter vivianii]MEB6668774.1 TonB-dependent siderophore receptor [Acinetobacter vivianii]